jgi:hypothetical protein
MRPDTVEGEASGYVKVAMNERTPFTCHSQRCVDMFPTACHATSLGGHITSHLVGGSTRLVSFVSEKGDQSPVLFAHSTISLNGDWRTLGPLRPNDVRMCMRSCVYESVLEAKLWG